MWEHLRKNWYKSQKNNSIQTDINTYILNGHVISENLIFS